MQGGRPVPNLHLIKGLSGNEGANDTPRILRCCHHPSLHSSLPLPRLAASFQGRKRPVHRGHWWAKRRILQSLEPFHRATCARALGSVGNLGNDVLTKQRKAHEGLGTVEQMWLTWETCSEMEATSPCPTESRHGVGAGLVLQAAVHPGKTQNCQRCPSDQGSARTRRGDGEDGDEVLEDTGSGQRDHPRCLVQIHILKICCCSKTGA